MKKFKFSIEKSNEVEAVAVTVLGAFFVKKHKDNHCNSLNAYKSLQIKLQMITKSALVMRTATASKLGLWTDKCKIDVCLWYRNWFEKQKLKENKTIMQQTLDSFVALILRKNQGFALSFQFVSRAKFK